MQNREPYVKPLVTQLHYSTEPEVAIASACKTTGATVGSTALSCRTSNPFVPCQTLGS
jgi:hypothetical protein